MQHLDLNLLKSFASAAEWGSISDAARAMHITQPALSLQLKKLEDQLGQRLFDRHRSGLVLTPFGNKLLVQTKALQHSVESILDLKDSESQEPQGLVRIATYESISSQLIPDLMAKFFRLYPKVSIQLLYPGKKGIIQGLVNYDFDLSIAADLDSHPSVDSTLLREDEIYLVANKDFPTQVKASELEEIPLLSYAAPHEFCNQHVAERFGNYLKRNRGALTTECFATLKAMLLRGIGAAFLPSCLVTEELKSGKLRRIAVPGTRLPVEYRLVKKRDAALSRTASAFYDFTIKSFSQ